MTFQPQVQRLLDKGAEILNPASVFIGPEVDTNRLSGSVTIFPGCRLIGKDTFIGKSCCIGKDGAVTIDNCQLASDVTLGSGTFAGATMLSGVSYGPSAHVRPATILEEQSSCAHTVGLKQTILFPFVTLGSLINFCDCFMSGGTSRKNHSEVGSSYIHFNYTPHQDKATPSLVGDVPRGVMLDQPPIFLGGQGGLVGPTTIEYGAITAAGTICRKDITESGKLVYEKSLSKRTEIRYQLGAYGDITRIIRNNLMYIGNLFAMHAWYKNIRSMFISADYPKECHDGALGNIELMIKERKRRMAQLADNMPRSLELAGQKIGIGRIGPPFDKQKRLHEEWSSIADRMTDVATNTAAPNGSQFVKKIDRNASSYLDAIRNLDTDAKHEGSAWLQSIVDGISALW